MRLEGIIIINSHLTVSTEAKSPKTERVFTIGEQDNAGAGMNTENLARTVQKMMNDGRSSESLSLAILI